MTGSALLALAVAAAAAYGSWVVSSAVLAPRVRRANAVIDQPLTPTPDDLDRLWVLAVQSGDRQRVESLTRRYPRVPRQYRPVGPPLDVKAAIAAMEPCGSGVMPTCRLHCEATCRVDTPCCPTCPTTTEGRNLP